MKKDDEKPFVDTGPLEDRPAGDGRLVERLLEAAGPGPEVPADGAERVKELIRPQWRERASAKARQRRLLWAGGLAAAAAMFIAAIYLPSLRPTTTAPTQQGIILALLDGPVKVVPPGSRATTLEAADSGTEIPRGSLVRTPPGNRAALRLTETRSLRLDVNTEVRLDSETSISLDSGAVYVSSSEDAGAGIEVRTALGTASDIGTQFEVRLAGATLDIKVREGLVSLARGSEEYRVAEGIVLSVLADGGVSTASITPYDPAWAWTQEIAPPFEIEGRSVLAFLDSGETGVTIQFADREVEQLAATTILHGAIEGLTPSQAPAVILPSCRLAATWAPGTLVVHRLEEIPSVP
jgi:ferric-dicitrate binding protein FerR (iron transport regulator)